ncbi:MAG: DUF2064 domain-containing protein [Saprospiraceae bacterium]|nr:DUF2064 domain-containing protein [Saprospiraceae bacterium]
MMSTEFDQTAVLIFSRSASQEAAVKVFDPAAGKTRNKAIAQSLIQRARKVARRSKLPVFFHSTAAQSAGSFGENFADALETVFGKGYRHIIAIGNDCPALCSQDLLLAAQHLTETALVFGPASDGGTYLLGIRREAYDRSAFLQIDWQTPLVLTQLQDYAQGDFICLTEKSDVDSLADLAQVLRTDALPVLLKHRLARFLQPLPPPVFSLPCRIFQRAFQTGFTLRGPPGVSLPLC